MQRESYQNPKIAKQLNQLAVPVKVDRELQPALDARLIYFTEHTTGIAGWPLNVFITPEGYPLLGFTYLPADQFSALLEKLAAQWSKNPDNLKAAAGAAHAALNQTKENIRQDPPNRRTAKDLVDKLFTDTVRNTDLTAGGFGGPNKFPLAPMLLSLLDLMQDYPNESMRELLELTLNQMARLGLRDHLGGGFYRYVVDPAWAIPHFEKMLYDNALLAIVYLKAADVFQSASYEQIAWDTLDFMLKSMSTGKGAFIASLSAVDDKGVEGGYYLWSEEALKSILSADEFTIAQTHWGINDSPELDAGNHLRQVAGPDEVAQKLNLPEEQLSRKVIAIKHKLLEARQTRTLPRDEKLLGAWNGLALSAYSLAAKRLANTQYRNTAKRLRDYLVDTLWDGRTLKRAVSKNGAIGNAALEDYAYVAAGLLDYAQLTGNKHDYTLATKVAKQGWQRFYHDGGWQLSEDAFIPVMTPESIISDGPIPSASALILHSLLRIATQNKDLSLREQVATALTYENKELDDAPFWYASHIRTIAEYAR